MTLHRTALFAGAAGLLLPGIAFARPTMQRPDTVVRVESAPVHRGVGLLVEEVTIGVANGDEPYLLGDISDMAIGSDGSIYAFDRQVPALRHYDANGRFVGNLGRQGRGPGEYLTASGITVADDGRVLLWDTHAWRVNVYAPNGDFLAQWSTPSGISGSSTASFSRGLLRDTAGRIVARRTLFTRSLLGDRPTVWIRYRPDGTVLDTLSAPEWTDPVPPLVATAGGARVRASVPFTPRRFISYSPLGHFVTGYPDRYAFELHRTGQPIVSVRRDAGPEPVSRSERNAERARVEERMRRTDPQWSWNGPAIPATKPLYGGLEVGLDGRIWIAVVPEVSPRAGNLSSGGGSVGPSRSGAPPTVGREPDPPGPALYDVFEPDGRYLGQVRVPAKVSTVLRRGDQVWAIAYDEDDVPRIKRYRIEWGKKNSG